MADCSKCKHSIFDEVWGEYKCKKLEITVYPIELYKDCELYEKDPKKKTT